MSPCKSWRKCLHPNWDFFSWAPQDCWAHLLALNDILDRWWRDRMHQQQAKNIVFIGNFYSAWFDSFSWLILEWFGLGQPNRLLKSFGDRPTTTLRRIGEFGGFPLTHSPNLTKPLCENEILTSTSGNNLGPSPVLVRSYCIGCFGGFKGCNGQRLADPTCLRSATYLYLGPPGQNLRSRKED